MSDLEDLKTRLKIAKSKLQNEDPKNQIKKVFSLETHLSSEPNL